MNNKETKINSLEKVVGTDKCLFKIGEVIYSPTLIGKIELGNIEVNENTFMEHGANNLRFIYGKNQSLILGSNLTTLNKSQVYLNEAPEGWHNTKEDFEIVFEDGGE